MSGAPPLGVDVVIPVHGKWWLTERCLDSLRQPDPCVRSITVVDDASPDETATRLRERSGIRVVSLGENRGFSTACNAGAGTGDAPAILFLNNDTVVPAGAVERLAAELARDPSIGAAGPKLLYADGTIQSAAFAFVEGRFETWRLYAHLEGDLAQANVAGDFVFLSGAALLVRRELFSDAGGFDEGYRNGVEDVDLCLRIRQAGYRVRYLPECAIEHLEGASRGRTEDQRANWRHFGQRWSAGFPPIPRYAPPPAPHLIVRWRSENAIDRLVRAHLARSFARYDALRATCAGLPGAAAIERAGSAIERRPVLEVSFRSGPAAVRVCAGADAGELPATPRGARIWAPSARAREQLAAAGIPRDRIDVIRLGFFAEAAGAAVEAPPVVVHDRTSAPGTAEAVAAALAPAAVARVDAESIDGAMLEALRRAPFAIFTGEGDPWGWLGGAALAAGRAVLAREGAPFAEAMPDDSLVRIAGEDLPAAAAELVRDQARLAGLGSNAAREMLLRRPARYMVRRIEELGRAMTGGIPEAASLEVTAEWS